MTKFLYVLVAILSALVTVWCSLSWTLCIAVFLGLSLLLLLLQQEGGVRLWREEKWPDNDTALKRTYKGNNTTVDQENKNYHKSQVYLKRKNSVNRNHNQSLGSDSEDEEIPGSVSTNARTLTTTIISIMSGLEKSISNSRLLSLFSVFNKKSNGENNRPASSPGRYNNNNRDDIKNRRQALRGNRRMAVGGDGTLHMSPSTPAGSRISRLNNAGIIGCPLSSPSRGRINTGYESGRTTRKGGSTSPHQRQGRFASPVTPSSPLSTSPFPRFHRTACESLDRPGINPVGFTPHALQRAEVCYPSNSSPGVLPHVRLEKRIKIPLVESNINKMRSPVTVRIAPPDTGVLHSPKFTSLKQDLDFPITPDTSDVLSALREGTRKRSNITGSEEDSMFESANNTAKRRRQESNHSTASSSSMPSLPDFLPDLSLCNFTPSSYMSPTSRYMVPSSAVSSSGSVTNPSSGVMAGSSGTGTGVKRPVAPCAHLSQSENSPNSKRPRQEVKNNPILSSLSSSQRYRLHKKEAGKRKIPDSPELQDPNASKENQETHSSDNHQSFEKPASKTTKLNRSVTEAAKSDADPSQPSVSMATTDNQSEETQANTSAGESKTPDLRSRRKHLSFATPGINLDRLSYANVYATKEDYENDRKAEQERVEKMLDRIATEKKVPGADILSEKNVVESREETTQTTSALTVPSMTISSSSKALTCTTAATSLIVSSTAASLTSSSSSPAKETDAVSSSSSTLASSPPPTVSLSIFSSAASATPTTSITTTTTSSSPAMLPSTSTLSSLLQSNSSPSTSVTPSSTTSFITVSQTTKTDLPSTSTKPTATSISLTPTSTASAFQPSMFGSSAATTSVQSPSVGGFQFGMKTSSALSSAASTSSSIPSTASPVATNVTASGFSLGTFSMASATSASTAPTSTTFMFGARAASPQTSPFTTGTTTTTATTTPATTTTNAGSLLFSSPSKDPPKQGGFSFNLVSPQATPTSSATPKTDNQQVSSPFSTPKTQISSTSSSSLFPFIASSAQTFTTATGAATAASTPATGIFTFGKSTPPVSLPQPSTPATSNIPSTGMFTFKPSDAATLKTSSSSVPTSNPTGIFSFKATADSTSAVTSPGTTDANFVFGTPTTSSSLAAFGSSSKAPPAFGVTTSGSTFGSASSKFGATSASSTPAFGATSTSPPVFEATTSAPVPAFGASTPAFGATSSAATPVFGASSSSSNPAFASTTSVSTPLFGSTKTAFGTTSSPFGVSSTASTAFGGSTTTAFGASSTTTPLFGASNTQTTQANTSSTGSFSFDSNSNTARQTSSTSAPSTGFNFTFNTAPTSPNTFNFGSTSTTSATGTTTTSSTAASSSTSIFGQPSSTFGGFSSANQDGQKSMFGSQSSNQSGFNFSGSSTNQTTNIFGQTGQQPQQTSLFHNSDQQQTSQPFTFGQGTTSGTNPAPFGQSSAFSSPQASSFGSFGAKPIVFATPTNNTDKPSQPTSTIFGSTPVSVASPNVTPQPKPLFGQVTSQPFGGSGTTPSNTGNTGLFGSTPTGQTSTPAGGSATSGIFTFGQSPGTQQPAANPNQGFDFSASIGGTSQFTFGQGGTSSKAPMFNMGSGSTAPKMRSFYPKARRRGAKK